MRNLAVSLTVVCGLLVLGGCPSPSTTVTDAQGNKMEVSGDGTKTTYTDNTGKTATVETDKDGTVSVKDQSGNSSYEAGKGVTEADLKLPFYPGSVEKSGATYKAETPEAKSVMSVRTTSDPASKVTEFYKPKLKAPSTMSTPDAEMVSGKLEGGEDVVVTASKSSEGTGTDVSVTVVTKK